ncbi:transposable element Tcb2 transposase [Trichonephila clavipes]|nr:transposable element Tcb2 transposase [Trichonephila clavipes]
MVELSAAWNENVLKWKYPTNLKLPKVSSLGSSNDSKTTETCLGQIGLYARRPPRYVPFTKTHCRLRVAWNREHELWAPQTMGL